MSDPFIVVGNDIDVKGLLEEIERRAGPDLKVPGPAEPPVARRAEPSGGDLFGLLLRSLSEDADVAQGFPPQSHRSFGNAVVAAKRSFRKAFQPLINETLARQKVFNRRLLDTLTALHAEHQALAARLAKLEKNGRSRADG